MIRRILVLAALLPTAAAAQSPESPELRGLWLDWRAANSESLDAEAKRAAVAARSAAEARSLGERVGELVASGDCEGGERMARDAGDFPLVDAVRNYCRTGRGGPS